MMNRTSECKYDDSSRKSHTRKLREHQEALETRLRELESERRNARPSTSSSPSIEAPIPTKSTASDTFSSTPLPSIDPLYFHIRPSSSSSATLSDRSASIPLGLAYHTNLPAAPSLSYAEPSVHDRALDPVIHESTVVLPVEMHNSLYVFLFRYVAFLYDDPTIESECSLSTESNAVFILMLAVSTHHHRRPYSKIRRPVLHS